MTRKLLLEEIMPMSSRSGRHPDCHVKDVKIVYNAELKILRHYRILYVFTEEIER